GDGVDGASVHAPGLGALHAGVGGVAGLLVEDVDADDRARRLEGAGLHPGTGQLALHAAGTLLRQDRQLLRHEIAPRRNQPLLYNPPLTACPAAAIRPAPAFFFSSVCRRPGTIGAERQPAPAEKPSCSSLTATCCNDSSRTTTNPPSRRLC